MRKPCLPPQRRLRGLRLKVFGVLWVIILLNYIDRATLSIAIPFISQDLHITPEAKGWIMGTFFWTYLIFQIPGGWLLDKFGPRRIITICAALWGLAQAAIGLAREACRWASCGWASVHSRRRPPRRLEAECQLAAGLGTSTWCHVRRHGRFVRHCRRGRPGDCSDRGSSGPGGGRSWPRASSRW